MNNKTAKLLRRHRHLFAKGTISDRQIRRVWSRMSQAAKGDFRRMCTEAEAREREARKSAQLAAMDGGMACD